MTRSVACQALLVLAVGATSLVGCDPAAQYRAKLADPAPPAEPVSHVVPIGPRQVRFSLPAKWRRLERDGAFKRSIGVIGVNDLGPVTPDGIYDAIERARDAFRAGRLERGQQLIKAIDLRGVVADDDEWRYWKGAWNTLRWAGPSGSAAPEDVETAYNEILSRVFRLREPDVDAIFDEGLRRIRHDDALREVGMRQSLTIDGYDAVSFVVWNRRSHDHRMKHLFVSFEGYLLVVRMELGQFDELEPAFDMIVETLELEE